MEPGRAPAPRRQHRAPERGPRPVLPQEGSSVQAPGAPPAPRRPSPWVCSRTRPHGAPGIQRTEGAQGRARRNLPSPAVLQARLFLSLVCAALGAVLYVLLCNQAGPWGCYRPPAQWGSPTASTAPRFQGYSRVPDGKPLERALCRRCAMVSSSGQMLGSHLGQAIDGEECVLRMNHAPTAGYEQDVGTRSTVRVVSHTSVPLLLRNQRYFFQQCRDTLYIIWGPAKKMSREKGGSTYQALLKVMQMYPHLHLYTLTDEKMTYCDDIFQKETGRNRMKSGSFLSTGWFTMILAMELCEHIRVFGMVSDSYCREKNHSSVPYHYFEQGQLDECRMYLMHERAQRAGHRFITEKTIFSRWAKRKNITFTHPSWAGG